MDVLHNSQMQLTKFPRIFCFDNIIGRSASERLFLELDKIVVMEFNLASHIGGEL